MMERERGPQKQGDLHDCLIETHRDVLLDSIREGVFTVDLDWRVTSFNRAAEDMIGIPRTEAIGRPCFEVFRANICENACALRNALSTGEPATGSVIYLVDTEGNRVPVRISATVLRDRDGQVIGGVETFQDLRQVEELRRKLEASYSFEDIIGRSPAMTRLYEVLPLVAANDSNVLIEGASGTGKELFAKAIHNLSPRRDKPLVVVNCGALPDTLLESELFGHKAGAFTGATSSRPGRIAAAEGGTLFLDEIGTISPALQVRLLRFLQERTYEPLGSDVPVHANVRVLAATNEDLSARVHEGTFREDLYYRVHVIHLNIPPLRNRREDIPILADHFIARFNRLHGKDVAGLSEEALAALMDYDYPGNVRELENALECAFVFCREGVIQHKHLPPTLRHPAAVPSSDATGLGLRAMEGILIAKALEKHAGNRTRAAKDLGIDPSTLYRKIKSLGIETPRSDGRSRKVHLTSSS